MLFKDRQEAGKLLADKLKKYKNSDTIALGLARGGVLVASEIAKMLHLKLDVQIVRKLGFPGNAEYALGAIALNGTSYASSIDKLVLMTQRIDQGQLNSIAKKEMIEIVRRKKIYFQQRKPINLKNRNVILIDDGLATGATVKAATLVIQKKKPKSIVLAVPVCPTAVVNDIKHYVNDLVCLEYAKKFAAVNHYFIDFPQISDIQVCDVLKNH